MADTTFGTDMSHYDAPLTTRDGLDFVTHKLTDGDHFYEDAEYQPAMDAARALGVPILGPYHVLHGRRSIANQADWLLARADALTPWWRQHDCFIWQCDAEPFSYLTAPTIDEINAFGDAVCARAGCPPQRFLAYAPAWHYGSALTGLRYRLWHSNYGSNPVGAYRSVYPGNTSTRWSGPVDPLLLQYGSNTTIAGQTTCDANAFRGSLDQLRAALRANSTQGDDVSLTDFQAAQLNNCERYLQSINGQTPAAVGVSDVIRWDLSVPNSLTAFLRALAADVAAVKAAVAALATTGTDADTAVILAKMQDLADADRARDEAHAAELAALRTRLAAAERAAADALGATITT